ncbi:energy transducer TonB [Candidatus Parcubacteria bacterium]|jgi:protein TonB|nr:energy transducer TonB [Candidatus Parcubacteria bacterium]
MSKHILLIIVLFCIVITAVAQKEVIINIDTIQYKSNSEIFVLVDKKPEFPRGKEGLLAFYRKTSLLKVCNKEKEVNCNTVYYQIVVDTLGNVGDFKIIRGINSNYDNETKRIISQIPKWKPGIKDGKVVNVLLILEISYKTH